VDVHLPLVRETGQPRGFAFVEFSTEAEAAEAIQKFNGQELAGRTLKVNEAEPPRNSRGPHQSRSPHAAYGKRPFKNKGSRRGIRRRKRSL
jgi:RNA recognition motif-containing protein